MYEQDFYKENQGFKKVIEINILYDKKRDLMKVCNSNQTPILSHVMSQRAQEEVKNIVTESTDEKKTENVKRKRGRPKGSKETLCNCHEWAFLGSYLCPVHGNQNKYRKRKM